MGIYSKLKKSFKPKSMGEIKKEQEKVKAQIELSQEQAKLSAMKKKNFSLKYGGISKGLKSVSDYAGRLDKDQKKRNKKYKSDFWG